MQEQGKFNKQKNKTKKGKSIKSGGEDKKNICGEVRRHGTKALSGYRMKLNLHHTDKRLDLKEREQ